MQFCRKNQIWAFKRN